MRKIVHVLILSVLLTLLCCTALASSPDLSVAGITDASDAYMRIIEAHPDAKVTAISNPYYTSEMLINALLTGGFEYDIYTTITSAFNVPRLIEKGYCADLSDNEEIRALVDGMYAPIAAQVRQGDAIYGLPINATINYLTYRPSAWTSAGLTEEDVPQTFNEFLDFLDRWMEDIQPELEEPYCVTSTFDETLYTKDSYTSFLVEMLIERYIMQCNYAGEPLRFNNPAFLMLLERCREVGQRLYELEPEPNVGTGLFEKSTGMMALRQLIPLTITAEQPPLIRMNVNLLMVYTDTDAKALAEEFALYSYDMHNPNNQAILMKDCEAIETPGRNEALALWSGNVAEIERRLESESMPADERDELELELERFRLIVESISSDDSRYLYSPETLALYRSYGDYFYIQPPHIFNPGTEEGRQLESLEKQYCESAISAEHLVRRLDEMARMIEMEGK